MNSVLNPLIPVWLDEAKLNAIPFRVLCHLWRRRNLKTNQCNPSIGRIAESCGVSKRTVMRALKQLIVLGFVSRIKGFTGTSNSYSLYCPSKKSRAQKEYADYLRTDYWKQVSCAVKDRAGRKCESCGSSKLLEAHHKTYAHRGSELDHLDDLICLCRCCHKRAHQVPD